MEENKITFAKCLKHLKVVLVHKWWVFKFCCYAGFPWRGFLHDFSKFSPTEFWESVKYVTGTKSPIQGAKKEKGYSEAWLHHKGRNKHHFEYWIDMTSPEKTPVIPFKYSVEMLCDTLAAGKTYQGKNWTKEYQGKYFEERTDKAWINPKIVGFLEEAYAQVAEDGDIKRVLNQKNLREIYDRNVLKDNK